MNSAPKTPETAPPASAIWGRLLWFLIGPAVLFVLAMMIVNAGTGWLTGLDIAFFVAIGLMILGRWMEIHSGRGKTANDEPATPAHFRRYVAVMVPVTLLVWTVANLLGNHLLQG